MNTPTIPAPAWTMETEHVEQDGVYVYHGPKVTHRTVTAEVVADSTAPDPQLYVAVELGHSEMFGLVREQFDIPVVLLDDLIGALNQIRDAYKEAAR